MRVLFLDFDGVLHPLGLQLVEQRFINGKPVARPYAVEFFCWVPLLAQWLQAHPDVVLVVHSSWRASHSEAALADYLGPLKERVLGATDANLEKYPSILAWLDAHPEVSSYRILDDALQEFPQDPADEAFIACDWQLGLSELAVQEQLKGWLESSKPGSY